jgi:hypothetical protein
MNLNPLKTLALAAFATLTLVVVACGGDDKNDGPEAAAGGGAAGGGTIPVTQALLESLPEYEGATLVSEWLTEGGKTQVRQYAVAGAPAQMADTVTRYYRDSLVSQGWSESDAHAAVSSFSKDGRQIILGRVGPEQQTVPTGATTLTTAQAPAGTGFYFTVEAGEG